MMQDLGARKLMHMMYVYVFLCTVECMLQDLWTRHSTLVLKPDPSFLMSCDVGSGFETNSTLGGQVRGGFVGHCRPNHSRAFLETVIIGQAYKLHHKNGEKGQQWCLRVVHSR